MIDISVIIVNYNVRYFIEQCLISVLKAKQNLNIEIIVVDNASVDNSVSVIESKFPSVHLIANKENVGFAKANNQAIKIARGKYFLLLNPDTLVEEDTLIKIYDFMEKNPDAGALGVKMIDGEGKFLPESKRSVPTITSSLFRFSGLSKLFPKSKIFNKYNLGYLDENEIHEIDVLSGAFMCIRTDILPQVGYLDEAFFMYGEDIDYSYRIRKAGFKIYYFPKTTIVHFKGESTKKSSVKYHNIFYKAMAIFAKKHYGGKTINPLLWIINIAVFGLAVSSYFNKLLRNYFLPILDAISFFTVFILIQKFWANYHFQDPGYYDLKKTGYLYAGFSLLWILSIALNKGYKKKLLTNSLKGLIIGSLIILVFYSLLPEEYRFSRAIILMGSLISMVVVIFTRSLLKLLFPGVFGLGDSKRRTVIVGEANSVDRVKRIMDINGVDYEFVGALYPHNDEQKAFEGEFIAGISSLDSIIENFSVDEVIFCLGKIEMSDVVDRMSKIGHKVKVKIVPDEKSAIIGSSGRNSRGEFYDLDMDLNLSKSNNRIMKYSFDFFSAIIILILYPLFFIINNKLKIKHIFEVLMMRKTWISYIPNEKMIRELPQIKKGIFSPSFKADISDVPDKDIHDLNLDYARNYTISNDIEYLFRHLFAGGR